jgi:hypothetical protein
MPADERTILRMSAIVSVSLSGTNRKPLDGFSSYLTSGDFSKIFRQIQVSLTLTRIAVTWHEDLCTVMTICRWILFKLGSVSENIRKENQNPYFRFKNFFPVFRHLWDNVEKHGRGRQATDYNATGRMRLPCWINKAKITNSEYLILFAFPLQQRWRERDSIWRYTYITSLV